MEGRGVTTTADPANLWGEPAVEMAEPIGLTTARKDLHNALSRTLHCVASAEDDPEVLKAWWLTVDTLDENLIVHGSDRFRLARATVDVIAESGGTFAIGRSDSKTLLAFLAKGPTDVRIDVSGGAWAVSHEEGRLTGLLHGGTPPDWRRITEVADEPTVVLSLSARFAQEAAAAATGGESGVVRVEYRDEQRPALYRSPGLDEWVMPVRTAPVAEVSR